MHAWIMNLKSELVKKWSMNFEIAIERFKTIDDKLWGSLHTMDDTDSFKRP